MTTASETLDALVNRLAGLPETRRKDIEALAAPYLDRKWLPNPGPQTDAMLSPADLLLYGGAGGGGKTEMGLGLAFTQHQRSLILRRKYANLGSLTERAIEINGTRNGFNGSPPPLLRTDDGRYIQFAGNQYLGDEQDWQGQPFDLKVFDEATQFLELQIRFHLGWLRSTTPGQRVRALLATNPPVDADGDWIIGMFRPWLDLTHHNPAAHGELRWYVTDPDGKDFEVPDGNPHQFPGQDTPSIPMSRTFIPAKLADNPYLIDTGYQAKLDGLPEPLRSAVRDGNFMAARSDTDFQVIPTDWVRRAQARWTPDRPADLKMTCLAHDVAFGGGDANTYAWRYGCWFDHVVSENWKGEAVDPIDLAARTLTLMRDNCPIVVDIGGGYGTGVVSHLRSNLGFDNVVAFDGNKTSTDRTVDGSLILRNKRAEAWWKFREALDPSQGDDVALPPDPELMADLTAPTFMLTPGGVQIEKKADLKKRLGRSPDKGDAVVMCWSEGQIALATRFAPMSPIANRGHPGMKQALSRLGSEMPSRANTGRRRS